MSSTNTAYSSSTVIATIYEIQNHLGDGWEYITSYGTQESAEECLHRTGSFEGLCPLITVDNQRWRIVKTEQIERSTVVVNVETVRNV
jgi:shikimate kinase